MSGDHLRLATWNIASNKNFDAIAAKISRLDVDVCALQEVSLDSAADLPMVFDRQASAFRDYHWHFAPALAPDAFGGGRPEHYGLGILSKTPLWLALSFQLGPYESGRTGDPEYEPRILQVTMPQFERAVIVANTHLAATGSWSSSAVRRSQAQRIAGILRTLAQSRPLILCGDFNAVPRGDDLAELRQVLPHVSASTQATYVGGSDRATIDFFFSSMAATEDIAVVSADGLSDHDIVVASF